MTTVNYTSSTSSSTTSTLTTSTSDGETSATTIKITNKTYNLPAAMIEPASGINTN